MLALAVLGLAFAVLGWVVDARRFHAGWLAAVTVFVGWPLGSMALLLIHALTGGRWGYVLRPALRVGVLSLPLLLPAVLPLFGGLADAVSVGPPRVRPNFYLNLAFFEARGAIYLIAWFGLGWLVLRGRDLERIAPFGLIVLALTATFASIDLTMSLDPRFVSSIYGMLAAAGMTLLALSIAVLLTARAPDAREDLGKLLLALVVLWIYLDFMQLLIVWQSDLAAEAPWYLVRARGFWGAVRLIVAAGHFVLPFFLLLSPRMQRSRPVLFGVAGLLIAMEVLRAWWTVLPSLGLSIGWIDIACMLGLGCGVGPVCRVGGGAAECQRRRAMSERVEKRALPPAQHETSDVGFRLGAGLLALSGGLLVLLIGVAWLMFPRDVTDARFTQPFPAWPKPRSANRSGRRHAAVSRRGTAMAEQRRLDRPRGGNGAHSDRSGDARGGGRGHSGLAHRRRHGQPG